MTIPLIPPRLSYKDIVEYAENFLKEYRADNELPVSIEEIIEFDLKIDIAPIPGLQKSLETDGFISGDFSCIYVDEFLFKSRPSRYRFTLAHEIGHFVLHKDLIERIRPASIADWKTFIIQVDQGAYGWLEWQANAFGGLVLVPEKFLKQDFSFELSSMQDKIAYAKMENILPEFYEEYVIEAIASKLIQKYEVSIEVLVKRMSKEIERGGLKIP